MGKKKSKSKTPLPPAEPEEVDVDFAAALLAEMGVEEGDKPTTQGSEGPKPEDTCTLSVPSLAQQEPGSHPRRNRRKEKLAQRDADIQKVMEEAEAEAQTEPNYRKAEIDQLLEKFASRELREVDIRPDGNCFFSSISDQLEHRAEVSMSVQELRDKAAAYIQANRDDFLPFLLADEGCGESEKPTDIDEYTQELVSTPMWGGEMEILALSSSLQMPIEVIQADSSYIVGENLSGPKLLVSYYTRIYGLGAHYNSVRDLDQI